MTPTHNDNGVCPQGSMDKSANLNEQYSQPLAGPPMPPMAPPPTPAVSSGTIVAAVIGGVFAAIFLLAVARIACTAAKPAASGVTVTRDPASAAAAQDKV